jgi:hypothetical protein
MATIRPTRDEVSDRFPILGFTVQTGGARYFEVMLTTDPSLPKDKRTPANFFSTRALGVLRAERGEAVYLVPGEVLQRFVGAPRLYYGLATFADAAGHGAEVSRVPSPDSPYVNLHSFTGAGPRRMQIAGHSRAGRGGNGQGYAAAPGHDLTWVGDRAQPGAESVLPARTPTTEAPKQAASPSGTGGSATALTPSARQSAEALDYDDGFGPMPPEQAIPAGAPAPAKAQGGPAAVVPIASAIVGAVMTRILNNEGDVKWELDQLQGIKHPHDNAAESGDANYQTTTLSVPGPKIENLITDQISADFEVRFQHNRHSLGNVEITNTGTNDAVGWGLQIKANIMNDANVYDGRAAINVRFYYRFTRVVGSDVIGINDIKLYADGKFEQNFRWTQSSALAQGELSSQAGAPVRVKAQAAILIPIVSAIVGGAMSRLLNNEGDVKWELDQLKGKKHPHDKPAEAGDAEYQLTTISVPGPKVENLISDQISADFEIRFWRNGRSLDSIEITNTRTNDAVGWGLQVKATIMDDPNVYDSRAALDVRFYYRFTRALGSDVIGIRDIKLFADGQFADNFRWTQSSALTQGASNAGATPKPESEADCGVKGSERKKDAITIPPAEAVPLAPPPDRSRAMTGAVEAAVAIGGVLLDHAISNTGDISWNLDQFRGIKHPNDVAPQPSAPFKDAATIRLAGWPKFDVGGIDEISADFTVDWQYNGRSLGNVLITNVGTNDAVGWGMEVRAQIMDDNRVYPPDDCAALRVRFSYRFAAVVGSDRIAITELHLYGDGTYEQSGRWEQNTFL